MRGVVVFTFFVLFFANARAQDSIRLTQRNWAGGVCCATGSDFTINFQLKRKWRAMDSLWIFIPGYRIHLSTEQLQIVQNKCSASFGWSVNSNEETYYEKTVLNYYGIAQKDVLYNAASVPTTKVVLFLRSGKRREVPASYFATFIAYP